MKTIVSTILVLMFVALAGIARALFPSLKRRGGAFYVALWGALPGFAAFFSEAEPPAARGRGGRGTARVGFKPRFPGGRAFSASPSPL